MRPLIHAAFLLMIASCFNGAIEWRGGGDPSTVVVSSILPVAGTWRGSVPVTITGSGFRSGASVTIGGSSCANVNVLSATSLTCTTSRHTPTATADVTVNNSNGGTDTLEGAYALNYFVIVFSSTGVDTVTVASMANDGTLATIDTTPAQNILAMSVNGPGTRLYSDEGLLLGIYNFGSTGELTESTYPASSGTQPAMSAFVTSLTTNLAGTLLYSTHRTTLNLAEFRTINMSTGEALTPNSLACSDCTGGALSSDGQHYYVVQEDTRTVSRFDVNSSTGALSDPSVGHTPSNPITPHRVALDPLGRFLYFSTITDSDIRSLDQVTMADNTSALAMGNNNPKVMLPSPDGRFLYVAVTATTGIVTAPVNGSGQFGAGTGNAVGCSSIEDMAIDPSGRFLFAICNDSNNNVAGFSINSTTGALTALGLQTVTTGANLITIR